MCGRSVERRLRLLRLIEPLECDALVVQRLRLAGLVARRAEEALRPLGERPRLLEVAGDELRGTEIERDRGGVGVGGGRARLADPVEEVGQDLDRLRDAALRQMLEADVRGDAHVRRDVAVLPEADRGQLREVLRWLDTRHGHRRARREHRRLDRFCELEARARERRLDRRADRQHHPVVERVADDAVVRLQRRIDEGLRCLVRRDGVLVPPRAELRLRLTEPRLDRLGLRRRVVRADEIEHRRDRQLQ
jgi:hypothetical protein